MEPVVREPVLADAEVIADLHVQAWRETYGHLLPDGFLDEAHVEGRRRQWTDVLSRPLGDQVIRVAEIGGTLIGFAWAGPSRDAETFPAPRPWRLHALYVLAEAHGTGVGQALLDSVLGDAPTMLWVARKNPRAIRFYERNGFRFDGVEQTDPRAPAITDARMVR